MERITLLVALNLIYFCFAYNFNLEKVDLNYFVSVNISNSLNEIEGSNRLIVDTNSNNLFILFCAVLI